MQDDQINDSRPAPRLAKVAEVAAFLGVHKTTVWRMVKDQEIPFVPVRGGRKLIRFRMEDIYEWVKKRVREPK